MMTTAVKKHKEKTGATNSSTSRAINLNKIKKALESKSSGEKFWTPQDGVNKVRLLPIPGSDIFWVEVQEIYLPKPDGKGVDRFVSPLSQDMEARCPANEAQAILWRTGQKELSRAVRANSKYFCNLMVKNGDTWEYKPAKLAFQVWRDLVEHCIEEAEDSGAEGILESPSLLDDQHGRIITIRRREVNGRIEYKTTVTEAELPVKKEWLNKCQTFAEQTAPSPVEEIEAALCEFLDVDDLSELSGGLKTKKAKSVPVEEEDDSDNDDDDYDEVPFDEEEDDDDDVDEEEEDDDSESDDEEDDEDELLEEEEDDDEDASPANKRTAKKGK